MFAEKLRSLLRFGALSTRYKDIYDMYYLSGRINHDRMDMCLHSYIYDDPKMRERDIQGVIRRVKLVFRDRPYLRRLQTTDKKWLDEDLDTITKGIIRFLESFL